MPIENIKCPKISESPVSVLIKRTKLAKNSRFKKHNHIIDTLTSLPLFLVFLSLFFKTVVTLASFRSFISYLLKTLSKCHQWTLVESLGGLLYPFSQISLLIKHTSTSDHHKAVLMCDKYI